MAVPTTVTDLRLRLLRELSKTGIAAEVVSRSDSSFLVRREGAVTLVEVLSRRETLTLGVLAAKLNDAPATPTAPEVGAVILAQEVSLPADFYEIVGQNTRVRPLVIVARWGERGEMVYQFGGGAEIDAILRAAGVTSSLRPLDVTDSAPPARRLQGALVASQARRRPVQLPKHPHAGLQLDRYRLERRLGRGFSAEVWKAKLEQPIPGVPLEVGETVALKIYTAALIEGFQSIRIQREFLVAATLSHPNLARVYDLVLSPNRPLHTFMSMEFVSGPTLKEHIVQRGPLGARTAIEIGRQLFSALQELHNDGALHRDVKAANILVPDTTPASPQVKLVDLGIVSVPTDDSLTAATTFLGSKHSAPLEQLEGKRVDERSDVYSVGSVMFHCLVGRSTYHNAGPEGAIVRRMLTRPELLADQQLNGKIPQSLIAFVDSCLSVDPSSRPGSAAECLEVLRRF